MGPRIRRNADYRDTASHQPYELLLLSAIAVGLTLSGQCRITYLGFPNRPRQKPTLQ